MCVRREEGDDECIDRQIASLGVVHSPRACMTCVLAKDKTKHPRSVRGGESGCWADGGWVRPCMHAKETNDNRPGGERGGTGEIKKRAWRKEEPSCVPSLQR